MAIRQPGSFLHGGGFTISSARAAVRRWLWQPVAGPILGRGNIGEHLAHAGLLLPRAASWRIGHVALNGQRLSVPCREIHRQPAVIEPFMCHALSRRPRQLRPSRQEAEGSHQGERDANDQQPFRCGPALNPEHPISLPSE